MAPHLSAVRGGLHPFITFPEDRPAATQRLHTFALKSILHGRRIDWTAVDTMQLRTDMNRLFQFAPYRRLFSIEAPVFEELVCEFFATFDPHLEHVTFRLGGVDRSLTMKEFGIAFGIWTTEEIETELYTTAVREFNEESSVYWRHITVDPTIAYDPTYSKASGIHLPLRYLHYILAHTFTGRKDSSGVVNTTEVAILSHIWRGIPVDLTRPIARICRDYATDPRKMTLGLGPFITNIARYLGIDIDGAELTMLSGNTIPVDNKSLVRMNIARKVGADFVLRSQDQLPAAAPPQRYRSRSPPPFAATSSTSRASPSERATTARLDKIEREILQLQMQQTILQQICQNILQQSIQSQQTLLQIQETLTRPSATSDMSGALELRGTTPLEFSSPRFPTPRPHDPPAPMD